MRETEAGDISHAVTSRWSPSTLGQHRTDRRRESIRFISCETPDGLRLLARRTIAPRGEVGMWRVGGRFVSTVAAPFV